MVDKINEVINFLYALSETNTDSDGCEDLSNLKLQKLLYYIQGHSLAKFDKKIFPNKIMAWMHGPVVVEIYQKFKHFNNNPIEIKTPFSYQNLDNEERKLITDVFAEYAKYSAWHLRNMTHDEAPWKNTYELNQNNEITEEKLKSFFKKLS